MNKEPLLRMHKRSHVSIGTCILVYLTALVLALLVCAGVIFLLVRMNPAEVFRAIYDGALGSKRRIWVTVRDTLVLLCVGVGLAPAFKMRFWNIGAEGQILIGGAVSAGIMIALGDQMQAPALQIVMFVCALAGGMLWGLIPTFFKIHWNTNETLFTLMMNYIATQIITYCVIFWENPKGSNSVGIINQQTRAGWLPELFGNEYGWNILLVLAVTVAMFVYLRYSKQGYEIAVVGESERTAKYAGISVSRVMARTMGISGAICGMAGFILVSGSSHTISTATAGGRGFTAIIVAWMAKFNTFVMIAIAFGITFMEKGAIQIASQYGLNENASNVLLGIILFFLIGAEFFIRYKVEIGHRKGAAE